ncbi:MAG: hypothetical protein WCI20_13805, partial [bacterium]
AIEAKMNPDALEVDALRVFRAIYPEGDNVLVSPFVKESYMMRKGPFEIRVCNTSQLGEE